MKTKRYAEAICYLLPPSPSSPARARAIENQIELCRQYIAMHFGEDASENVLVYEDEGFSGKDFQRPQFRRMLEDIRRARPEAWYATGWIG
mgnify:CR=1 FL=1